MDHHVAKTIAAGVSILAGMTGAGIAIFAGVWYARHPSTRGFDFIASARRIRTMPVRAPDDAQGS